MDQLTCSSCSEPLCCPSEYLKICKNCSTDLINHLFSPAKYSVLSSIIPVDNSINDYQELAKRKLFQYNHLSSSRNAFDCGKSRDNERFIKEFYNDTNSHQNRGVPNFFVWDRKSKLFEFSLDCIEEKSQKFKNVQIGNGDVVHSLVSDLKGNIMICVYSVGNPVRYYLFHKDLSLDLIFSGPCPFAFKPILTLSDDKIYCFNEDGYYYKYVFESNRWQQLLAQSNQIYSINTLDVGRKILLTGSNKTSLFVYDTLGDYLEEFENTFNDSNLKKILLFDGVRVIYVIKDIVQITDLKFTNNSIQRKISSTINELVSPPVFYKGKFFMVSNEFIYRLNVDNSKIEAFKLENYVLNIDYLLQFK